VNLDKLLEQNSGKAFYAAKISITTGAVQEVRIRECSSLGNGKVIGFGGVLRSFDYSMLSIDTSILFNRIGENNKITYQVTSKAGGDYHANGEVLILKLNEKYFIGFSIDGCDVLSGLTEIINTYFIFNDGSLKTQLLAILKNQK